jgi:hypothetical protein
VISFLNRANSFSRVCLFCNFVRNKIYVMEIEMLKPVVLARYLYLARSLSHSIHFTNQYHKVIYPFGIIKI